MALQSTVVPVTSDHPPKATMWQKLKEQLPAVLITVVIIFGAAYWIHEKTVQEMSAKQQAALDALREQHAAELRASAEETGRRIEAVNNLLKDAIQKRAADALMTDEEFAKINADKVNQLAEAIATKIQPYNPLPKTPEEAEKIQNEQVDKVSSRMADKIQPILAEMAKDQNLTRDSLASYSQKISDQVGAVLTAELAKNQQLNNNLQSTQAIARDSLRLSHEVTALYLSSFKDQGLVTRLLSLPANVVRDATTLSFVNSSERRKVEERLVQQMNDIEKRLNDVQAQAPRK
ncbi:MAG TPA: hypothetical protein VFT72_13915 [Opitutaceae bacterium]|nr:hypothetical protein [Opitutaceae bacterium]